MNAKTLLGVALVVLIGYFVYASWWQPANTSENADTSAESTAAATEKKTESAPKQSGGTAQKPAVPAATQQTASGDSSRFCPKFGSGAELGHTDGPVPAGQRGDISNLQYYLAQTYGLSESSFVTGSFNAETESYVKRWQRETGISQTGVLDSETIRLILQPCVAGERANGVEYAIQSFSIAPGNVAEQLVHVHEALLGGGGTVETGAPRIELIATSGGVTQLRVTAPILGGLRVERFSLAEGAEKRTGHSQPITIKVVNINSAGAILSVSR